MIRLILSVSVLLFIATSAFSQKKSEPPPTSKGDEFNRFEYAKNYEAAGKKQRKKDRQKSSINAYYDQKIVEYEERMKENVKKRGKMRKEMKKPQYSDPTYFGHKKPPKKRRPGKKKFCKVCELYH